MIIYKQFINRKWNKRKFITIQREFQVIYDNVATKSLKIFFNTPEFRRPAFAWAKVCWTTAYFLLLEFILCKQGRKMATIGKVCLRTTIHSNKLVLPSRLFATSASRDDWKTTMLKPILYPLAMITPSPIKKKIVANSLAKADEGNFFT